MHNRNMLHIGKIYSSGNAVSMIKRYADYYGKVFVVFEGMEFEFYANDTNDKIIAELLKHGEFHD